ncbi:hypothetical protein OY671_012578, partial [Metschnikowia pulcherrima]
VAAGRRAGAAVGRGEDPGRLSPAHRHVGARQRHQHGDRHRADAEARAHHGSGDAGARGGGAHQCRRQPAQGREDRAVLRPRRSRRHHRRDGAAQPVVRHRPDLPDPVGFPRQPASRADRRRNHTCGAVPRGDDHGGAGRIRKPALGRRD